MNNHSFRIQMQNDSNLAIYNSSGTLFWASETYEKGGGNYLQMRDDGNLVMYQKDAKTIVWQSYTIMGIFK